MISKRIENIIKYYNFEIKIKTNYIHRSLYNRLDNYINMILNLKINSLYNFEEGVFVELNNMNVIGIVPTNSDSIYYSISQPFQIKDFTFEKEHFIHKILAKKNNFDVEINGIKYFIQFEKEDTRFKKPLNISIIRHHTYTTLLGKIKEDTQLLDRKKYYHIRRRIYNNIVNINKLRDGLIKKYQVFNEFELKVLEKYLNDKNILFRVVRESGSYKIKYDKLNDGYKYWFSKNGFSYPYENKLCGNMNFYVEVYKGYVNLYEIKDRYQQKDIYKYGIYLY